MTNFTDKLINLGLLPPKLAFTRRAGNKKPTVVFLHGIGSSKAMWDDTIKQLPDQSDVVAVDLLGFGQSDAPENAKYDLPNQAKVLHRTLKSLGVEQAIVCGHSLGSLVAIDFAHSYPELVTELILCAPPIYQPSTEKSLFTSPEQRRFMLYQQILKRADSSAKILELITNHPVLKDLHFKVTTENFPAFAASLQRSIINQDSFSTIQLLKIPIQILYGLADPLIIPANLKLLASQQTNLNVRGVPSAHHLDQSYIKHIIKLIKKRLHD